MQKFVEDLRGVNGQIEFVIDLSVCSYALANVFPSFNMFEHKWVLLQGGLVSNWAEKIGVIGL